MTNFFDTSPATTTETTNQTTTANPWAQASPLLTSMAQYYSGLNPAVTGQQTQAGQNLWGEASAVPSYGVQGAGAVNNLFSGLGILPSAYSKLQQNLGSVANPNNTNPYNTPGFSDALNTMTNNITNAVKGVYSGSGRSPSGAGTFAKTLGLGLRRSWALRIRSTGSRSRTPMHCYRRHCLSVKQVARRRAQGRRSARRCRRRTCSRMC